MSNIEIYKTDLNTIWNDDKTFLSVFDNKGNQIADYDFASGLKLLQSVDNKLVVFIDEKDLIPGKWKFFGTKVVYENEKIYEKTITAEGKKESSANRKKPENSDIWNIQRMSNAYVTFDEREKRIEICRKCEFFNQKDFSCAVDGKFVLFSTKLKYASCPENKWGDQEKTQEYLYDTHIGDIIPQKAINIDQKEQDDFEKEFEEFLKG